MISYVEEPKMGRLEGKKTKTKIKSRMSVPGRKRTSKEQVQGSRAPAQNAHVHSFISQQNTFKLKRTATHSDFFFLIQN